ncbi:MAG: hypothetical protein QM784_19780 [Polyangiaceae bacterium]
MHFVPSMLPAFLAVELDDRAGADSWLLRRTICSGEELPARPRPRASTSCSAIAGVELRNFYGPTEAAIDVTEWAVSTHAVTALAQRADRPPRSRTPSPRRARPTTCQSRARSACPASCTSAASQLADGYLGRPD